MRDNSPAAKRRRADAKESIGLPRTNEWSGRKAKPKRTKHNGFLLDYKAESKRDRVPRWATKEAKRLGMRRQQVDRVLAKHELDNQLREVWE